MNNTIIAILTAFISSAIICKMLIPFLTRLKFGQQVRDDGPKSHEKKTGTPTIGGIGIIAGFLLGALFFALDNPDIALIIIITVLFGIVGFLDDFIKIKRKRSLGLRAWHKLVLQLIISIGFFVIWQNSPAFSSAIIIPFIDLSINLGWFYPVLVIFVFLSATNGSNFTDGLDGLCSSVTAVIAIFFIMAAFLLGSNISPVIGAMFGALLGFLLYNAPPAKVFMGDAGSLALGGFVAAVALILHMPLFLFFTACIYVIESISVIIQIGYFKLTKKRFFKMAPIHHSFELSGYSETKITAIFIIITIIASLIGIMGL